MWKQKKQKEEKQVVRNDTTSNNNMYCTNKRLTFLEVMTFCVFVNDTTTAVWKYLCPLHILWQALFSCQHCTARASLPTKGRTPHSVCLHLSYAIVRSGAVYLQLSYAIVCMYACSSAVCDTTDTGGG